MKPIIFLVSDHGGFELKNSFVAELAEYNNSMNEMYSIVDLTTTFEPLDDYTDKAEELANSVLNNPDSKGFAFCSSGQGICMGLNRFGGIRAALTSEVDEIELTRAHNDSNVLCIPGVSSKLDINGIIHAFLGTEASTEERHVRRRNHLDKLGYNR